jgi:hypothetical protein
MSKNYLALSFPLFTRVAVLLKKQWDYEKGAAEVTILSNLKQWNKWCSESGFFLREEDKSLIIDWLAGLEERKTNRECVG